jgi:hypothetical protein
MNKITKGDSSTLSPDILIDDSNLSSERKSKDITKAKVSMTLDTEVLQALKDSAREKNATVSSLANLMLKCSVYALDRHGAKTYENDMAGMEWVNILVRRELAEFLRDFLFNPSKYLKRDDYGIIDVANIITHCLLTNDRVIAFRLNENSEILKHNMIDGFEYRDRRLLDELRHYMHAPQ